MTAIQNTYILPETSRGRRLDQALASLLPEFSRTQIQSWIKQENITCQGQPISQRYRVLGGESIVIDAILKEQPHFEPEAIDLSIVYEDDDLLIINKPAGLVVHPGAGNSRHTLLNALLHYSPQLNTLPRAGIVHRLDKDTSGLLAVAKTSFARIHLMRQIKNRTFKRLYQAVVRGTLISGGTIDAPIGRHPRDRKRMAIVETGKSAVTHYRLLEKFRDYTRIQAQLETGRTHQIRVHCASIRHALLGDPLYGPPLQLPKGAPAELITALRQFKRQALHAYELGFTHPKTNEWMLWQAPLPPDLVNMVEVLRTFNHRSST